MVVALASLTGCQRTHEVDIILDKAEAVLDSNRAHEVLAPIREQHLMTEEQKARYALVLSDALLRVKETTRKFDDRLISEAVDYYQDSDDVHRKMMSYYVRARIYYGTNDFANSIVDLMKAEDVAKASGNLMYLGKIYRLMYEIYNKSYNGVEALHYARKSYECFRQAGDDYTPWAMLSVGRAYHNLKDYDKSVGIAMQVADSAQSRGYFQLGREANRLMTSGYIAEEKYQEALKTLDFYTIYWPQAKSATDYRNFGLIYLHNGNVALAKYYLRQLRKVDSTDMRLEYELNYKTGNYKAAFDALKKERDMSNDVIVQRIVKQNVTASVFNFHNYENRSHERELKQEKTIRTIIIVSFAVVVILLSVILVQRARASRKEREKNLLMAQSLSSSLELKQAENGAMQDAVNNLFAQKFDAIDKLCSTYYECQGAANEKKRIHSQVMEMITGLSSDKKTVAELEAFVNGFKDNLMADFKNDFPDIKNEEYGLFLYSVAGFSSRAISVFLGKEISWVYLHKSRLKSRIRKSGCPNSERYVASL